MSSLVRSYASPVRTVTDFHRVESPSYLTEGPNLLFPFTYNNGTLDIEFIDDFEAQMVTSTGNEPLTDPDVSIRIIGSGSRLVQTIGDNFKAYIRAWRTGIDSESPISVYIPGIVTKVQWQNEDNMGDGSFEVSTNPPSGDTYTQQDANGYKTTYIFKRPLTITTVESGITQYITFSSRLDED